jgi:hypothetical protein
MDDSSGSPIEAGSSSRERRSVPRYGLIAQTEIVEPTSGLRIAGRLSEISSRGCYVDLLNTLPVSTIVEVHVSRDQGTFTSGGRVIYAQDGMGMGIAFLEMPDDQSKILSAWLEELQPS